MMDDLVKLKNILITENLTCVIKKGDKTMRLFERGIKPLIKIIEDDIDVKNALVADKVVGKAAAFLYCKMQVEKIYALTISEPTLKLLKDNDIFVEYENLVPLIKNRSNTGLCPMESAVIDETDVNMACEILHKKLNELSKNS